MSTFCSHCGAQINEGINFCPSCGTRINPVPANGGAVQQPMQPPAGMVPPQAPLPHVETHLVKAILVTIFCCQPFGIVSIVYAAQVEGRLRGGDVDGALRYSKKADDWSNWGLLAGLIVVVLYAMFMAVMFFFNRPDGF